MKFVKILTAILAVLSSITGVLSFLEFDKVGLKGIWKWAFRVGSILLGILLGLFSISYTEVPYTIDSTVENAIQTLQERGFKNIEIIPDDYKHSAKVVNQNPKEGYKTNKTKIALWLETEDIELEIEPISADSNVNSGNSDEDVYYEPEPANKSSFSEQSSEDTIESDNTYENYFNLTETHHPDDAMNSCYINNWSKGEDLDVRGLTYNKGVLYEFNNTLALLGGSSADEIQSDLRFAFIPGNPKPNVFRAKVVVHNDSAGTNATAKISWIVDDVMSGELEEINGNTIQEMPIEIDISNMEYYFTIHINAMPYGDGIKFGIVDYEFE